MKKYLITLIILLTSNVANASQWVPYSGPFLYTPSTTVQITTSTIVTQQQPQVIIEYKLIPETNFVPVTTEIKGPLGITRRVITEYIPVTEWVYRPSYTVK